jgi:hypothetical protein
MKQAYEVQFLEKMEDVQKKWMTNIWSWHIPLRINFFCWLIIENRILTWDNLTKGVFLVLADDSYVERKRKQIII